MCRDTLSMPQLFADQQSSKTSQNDKVQAFGRSDVYYREQFVPPRDSQHPPKLHIALYGMPQQLESARFSHSLISTSIEEQGGCRTSAAVSHDWELGSLSSRSQRYLQSKNIQHHPPCWGRGSQVVRAPRHYRFPC